MRYLVTKHHGAMICHVGRIQNSLKEAKKLAVAAALSKGNFRPKATVAIWRIVEEKEIVNR